MTVCDLFAPALKSDPIYHHPPPRRITSQTPLFRTPYTAACCACLVSTLEAQQEARLFPHALYLLRNPIDYFASFAARCFNISYISASRISAFVGNGFSVPSALDKSIFSVNLPCILSIFSAAACASYSSISTS